MALQIENDNVTDIEEPLLARLLVTLEEMIKRYQRLLSVLQREKELIIDSNLNDLTPCLLEKERLLVELKQLEETRLSQVHPLTRWFGPTGGPTGAANGTLPLGGTPPAVGLRMQISLHQKPVFQPQSITLRQLIDVAPEPYRGKLSSCYERLRALSASVTEVNQINGLLSSRILQQVNSLLGLLTHLSAIPSVYQASGLLHSDFQGGAMPQPVGMFYIRG